MDTVSVDFARNNPSFGPFDYLVFQAQVLAWTDHNFPDKNPSTPLLGMVEELGELADGILALEDDKIRDSLGDIVVFSADYCNQVGYQVDQAMQESQWALRSLDFGPLSTVQLLGSLMAFIGMLSHHHIKAHQGIRGDQEEHLLEGVKALVGLYSFLLLTAQHYGWNLDDLVRETWDRVRQRDWKKDPQKGGEA